MKMKTMRVLTTTAIAMVLFIVAACGGGDDDDAATDGRSTASRSVTTSGTDATGPTTTGATTTDGDGGPSSAPDSELPFTVSALGRNPARPLGPSPALGSGCAPNADVLPDGAWFGWIAGLDADRIEFDLACLWPGRLESAASNDAARIRSVPVAAAAMAYPDEGEPVDYQDWVSQPHDTGARNAPGLPPSSPFWVFINDAAITEVATANPVHWARSASAWPGLMPGCCDAGDVAPPSPEGPWPSDGWPADGFYYAIRRGESADGYDLTIHKWISCKTSPQLCPDWWVGDEVTIDPDATPYNRLLPFDETTTIVIQPIFSDASIVSDGRAFGDMLAELNRAIDPWADDEYAWPAESDVADRAIDPAFPFGIVVWPDGGDTGPVGYRAPGGTYLTAPQAWWTAIEIRNGNPILYIAAGQVAG